MKLFIRHIIFLFCLFPVSNNVFAYTITKFTAQSLCLAFPTAYVSGSFSIAEATKNEFGKNQTNNTIFFDLPTGWEYNTSGLSVTGTSSNDITAISIARTTATRLTVTLTTAGGNNVDLNTITVSCQIRATSATAALFIKRDGGTFKIAKSTSKPTTTESLGDLSAKTGMGYTSSTVTQPNTTSVYQGTIDNNILRVEVVVTGTCNAINLTQLNFNTTGSTSAADITTASVYYTGLSSTFSPTGLFGSVDLPSGNFNITGTRALTDGTNYFWLVYDVAGAANTVNVLDAQCTSITVDGAARTPTATNPAGTRAITTLTQYYSRATGNWDDNANWSATDGGVSCACQPNGLGSAFINTDHTITLNATRTIDFITVRSGAVLQDNGTNTLTVTIDLNTLLSGKFAATSAWTVSGNLKLSGTGASTTTKDITITGSAVIRSGTSLTENGVGGEDIILKGNLTLNGTLSSGTAGGTIIMNGGSTQTISGSTGTVSGTGALTLSTSAKTIAELTTLTISPTVAISGAITVTNNGTITLSGNLTGSESGSTWTNAANSTLKIAGTVFATGTLTATASPNTVDYNKATAQTVKTTNYDKLTISNALTKTFQSAGTISVANLVTIQDAAIFDVGTNTLSGAGGLTMTGTSELQIAKTHNTILLPELTGAYNLTAGTITLNQGGSATQKANDGPRYYNLKLNGGASSVYNFNALITVGGNFTHSTSGTTTLGTVDEDIIVTGSSTFSNGTFNANGSDLKTGSLTLTSGTLTGGAGTIEITGAGGWTKNGGTFTNTSNTVLFSGTAEQTIAGTDATTFNSLTLNNSSGLSLSDTVNATVSGTLTFTSGIIKTNANRIIVGSAGSAGTITRTSGHVNGNLRRYVPNTSAPTVDYAIGDATDYTPASIAFVGGTNSGNGYLDASTSAIDPAFGALSGGSNLSSIKYIKRRWVVTNTNVAGFTTYSPTFTFVAGDIKGSAATGSLVIRKLDGSTWASTTVGTKTSTSTQSTGLSTFSEFAVGETAESCQPTVSAAGADQSIYTTTATLAGNTPSVGTGAWTLISGTGTITTTGSATSGLTALGVGANTFRWTISNSPCAASTDDVIITRNVQSGMPLDLLIGY